MRIPLLGVLLAAVSSPAVAGLMTSLVTSVPTLDEVGLFALIGILGAVGGWLARRNKK